METSRRNESTGVDEPEKGEIFFFNLNISLSPSWKTTTKIYLGSRRMIRVRRGKGRQKESDGDELSS